MSFGIQILEIVTQSHPRSPTKGFILIPTFTPTFTQRLHSNPPSYLTRARAANLPHNREFPSSFFFTTTQVSLQYLHSTLAAKEAGLQCQCGYIVSSWAPRPTTPIASSWASRPTLIVSNWAARPTLSPTMGTTLRLAGLQGQR
jgi:hypothetical protein